MWKKYFLPILVAVCALSVSSSAAFFSVYGLSKLFAGASLAVIIMATSLEISKLLIVSLLHQYWQTLPKLLKGYFITATVILVVITSIGIYGFLSNAYQQTSVQNEAVQKEVSILEIKKELYTDRLGDLNAEKVSATDDISELRKSLTAGTTVQYVDKTTGQLVTSTSSAARKTLETQLGDAIERRDKISTDIVTTSDSIVSLELQIIEVQNNNSAVAELGPLIYLSRLTGAPMDNIINWLLIVLVIVFDPLAVCLVLAVNYTTAGRKELIVQESVQKVVPVKKEEKDVQKVVPVEKKSYINSKQLTEKERRRMSAQEIYDFFQSKK